MRAEINTVDPSGQALMRDARPSAGERGTLWWLLSLLATAVLAGVAPRGLRRYKHRRANRSAN